MPVPGNQKDQAVAAVDSGFFMCRFPGARDRAGSDAQCGHSDCHHSIMHRHIAPITAI